MRIIDRIKKPTLVFCLLVALFLQTGLLQTFCVDLTDDEEDKIAQYRARQEELSEQIRENKEKMSDLKDDIERQEEYVRTLQAQIDSYQDQINLLNNSISLLEDQKAEIQVKIDELDEQIAGINEVIGQNRKRIVDLKMNVEDIKEDLRDHLCDVYVYGKASEFELLFNSKDFESYLLTKELSTNIADTDQQIIEDLRAKMVEIDAINAEQEELIKQLQAVQEEHQAEIDALDEKEQEIISTRTEVKSAQDDIVALEREATDYLEQLDEESAAYQAMISKMEADSEEFDEMIDDIIREAEKRNAPKTFKPSSGLIWPLQYSDAYISSGYGYRTGLGTAYSNFHGGVDTCRRSGTYGANISAAANGVVLTAAYNSSGYGYYILLDHGNGMYTLYGHNSQLLVSVGETVTQGQVIAKAGATGYAYGAHCHFEVRINGAKVDPTDYASLP